MNRAAQLAWDNRAEDDDERYEAARERRLDEQAHAMPREADFEYGNARSVAESLAEEARLVRVLGPDWMEDLPI